MALYYDSFDPAILIGALATTLFLQVLSNLANDYGDFVNGVDNESRIGPERSVQSGIIRASEMKTAIILFTILSLASGIWLLSSAIRNIGFEGVSIFFVLGLLAIGAAIKYTVGKNPYGYQGLGDVAVFIFFGITGVAGTLYLHTAQVSPIDLLPAVSIGALSTGVLNLNNMRDHDNDRESGKRSLVVMMGVRVARYYHLVLLGISMIAALSYTFLNYQSPYQLLFLITTPMLIRNGLIVWRSESSSSIDGELKKLAITTLVYALTLGIGLLF